MASRKGRAKKILFTVIFAVALASASGSESARIAIMQALESLL